MHTFFVPPDDFSSDRIQLTGDEYRHATRAARVAVGDLIAVTDGCGRRAIARIEMIDAATLTAAPVEDLSGRGEPVRRITLALALIQPRKFEQAVEQCTELGVRRIVPLFARRCTVAADRIRLDRLQAIALGAAKQAGRSVIPVIEAPVALERTVDIIEGTALVCAIEGRESIAAALRGMPPEESVTIFVGPEGDFMDAERDILASFGARAVTLGGLVLRAETAAMVATAFAASR